MAVATVIGAVIGHPDTGNDLRLIVWIINVEPGIAVTVLAHVPDVQVAGVVITGAGFDGGLRGSGRAGEQDQGCQQDRGCNNEK